jgi:hypothetical protein
MKSKPKMEWKKIHPLQKMNLLLEFIEVVDDHRMLRFVQHQDFDLDTAAIMIREYASMEKEK